MASIDIKMKRMKGTSKGALFSFDLTVHFSKTEVVIAIDAARTHIKRVCQSGLLARLIRKDSTWWHWLHEKLAILHILVYRAEDVAENSVTSYSVSDEFNRIALTW